jgi:hypothetical protein
VSTAAPAVDPNKVDKVIKETPVDTTALAAARRARVQALKDYLVKAVLDARNKDRLQKVSNNKGDLTEAEIKPTQRTDARDVNAAGSPKVKAKTKKGRRVVQAAEALQKAAAEAFNADLLARRTKIQRLQEERDRLEKASMDSGASGSSWAHSSARIGIDAMLAQQKLALSELYRSAPMRPDLLEALEAAQQRAAGRGVFPPVPSDRDQLRSAFDGSYPRNNPNPAETMTSGQLRNLEKRLERSTDPNERQRLGDELTRAKLYAAAQAQFPNAPLAARGRG